MSLFDRLRSNADRQRGLGKPAARSIAPWHALSPDDKWKHKVRSKADMAAQGRAHFSRSDMERIMARIVNGDG